MTTRVIALVGMACLVLVGCVNTPQGGEPSAPKDVLAGKIEGLNIETLKTSRLKLVDGVEVVMSRVQVPANTTLPKHYHPGEEFIYVLAGSGALWLKGQGETSLKKGDVFKVPLKAIHTFITRADGARILVCRVHESGKPMRYNVEQNK